MLKITFTSLLTLVLTFGLACDKGGDEEESSGNRYDELYGDTPPIDCADYARRINECPEEFLTVYATTETAVRAGEGDGAQGAEYYRQGLSMVEQVCQDFYSNKDPHWHARYNECLTLEPCAAWANCAASAVGNPIGSPEL